MNHHCGSPTPSGPCNRQVADSVDHCFMHDDSGPPSSHGAPPKNDNAIGNSGGGAPIGNYNAATYHGWSDPELHYERLEGDAKSWVEERITWHTKRARADLSDGEIETKARQLATIEHQSWLAVIDTLSRGLTIEREHKINGHQFTQTVANPANEAIFRLANKKWQLREDLGLNGIDQ